MAKATLSAKEINFFFSAKKIQAVHSESVTLLYLASNTNLRYAIIVGKKNIKLANLRNFVRRYIKAEFLTSYSNYQGTCIIIIKPAIRKVAKSGITGIAEMLKIDLAKLNSKVAFLFNNGERDQGQKTKTNTVL